MRIPRQSLLTRRHGLAVAMLAICAVAAPQDAPPASEHKLSVTVNLVQIDAVVTDSHGKHVTNLAPSDFEVLLDGRPQPLQVFELVKGQRPVSASPAAAAGAYQARTPGEAPPAPEPVVKPQDVRRTMVLFVDDFSLSADRVTFVRKALHDMVDKQMQPGDLVAIVRASAGLGARRDFTTDKRLLNAAADQVRWNSAGKAGMSAFGSGCCDNDHSSSTAEEEARVRGEYFAALTVESLRRLVDGMANLPGRKAVIILASEFPLALPEYDNGLGMNTSNVVATAVPLGSMMERALRLVDAATRASVVFYGIDTKLLASQPELDDIKPKLGKVVKTQALSPGGYGMTQPADGLVDPQAGNSDYLVQRSGGIFLSSKTGGLMLADSNGIRHAIARILDDSEDYYLLGFSPPEEAFNRYDDGRLKFNRITIRLRQPGLHVRSRAGFFGESDPAEIAAAPQAGGVVAALDSPFRSEGVGVDVTCSVLKAGRNLPSIRVSMIVRAQDLTLEGPVYNRSAIVHLLIRAFGVNGADLDRSADKLLRVSLNEEGYQRALKFGLVYAMEVEVAKPGPYRVRVALRDEASGRMGTASQYLVVPNFNGRKLALSGLIFAGSYGRDDDIVPAPSPIALVPGSRTRFAFEIFGAHDKARSLESRIRLFRDGAQVYEGPVRRLEVSSKLVHSEAVARDDLVIPAALPAGDYALQEEIIGDRPGSKPARAWQWAELRVATGGP